MKKIEKTNNRKMIFMSIQIIYQIMLLLFFAKYFMDHSNIKIKIYFGVVFFILSLLGWGLLYKIVHQNKFTYKKILVLMMPLWTVVFSMIFPFMAFQDAAYHVCHATGYANIINETADEGIRYGDKWIYDFDMYQMINMDTYEDILESPMFSEEDVKFSIKKLVTYFSRFNKHFLPGVGIAIMRFLHIGPKGIMLLMGVPYSVFMFICALIAMKILPAGKLQLIQLMLVPMLLNLYTSAQYDVPSLGFGLLYISFCLYLAEDDIKLQFWHVIILIAGAGILVWAKSVTVFLACMTLCIPWRKKIQTVNRGEVRKKWYKVILCVGGICAIPVIILGFEYIRAYMSVAFMEPEILQTCTVSHLIHNPVQFVQIVKNSFKSIFVYTIPAQISYSLGFLNVYTSKGLAYLYFAIMCISLFINVTKEEFVLNKRKRIVTIVTVVIWFFAIGLGSLAMFYPVDADAVAIFGRYAMVALFVFFLGMASKQKESLGGLIVIYFQHIILSLIMLQSLVVIVGR